MTQGMLALNKDALKYSGLETGLLTPTDGDICSVSDVFTLVIAPPLPTAHFW
jgi:hypothetical protein